MYLSRFFLLIITLSFGVLISQASADGFYKWKDARGNIQYGDEPPANVKAKRMKMPAITVLNDYGKQWIAPEEKQPVTYAPNPVIQQTTSTPKPQVIQYKTLGFIAPKPNQVINAENGDVSAILSIKPPLKRGHKFRFMVDGRKASEGKSRITNFLNLQKGDHSVIVNVIDQTGAVIQKSQQLNFRVHR